MPDLGNRAPTGIDVAFGKLADFAGTLSKGAYVAVEGELRIHEYQREIVVGTQKTTLTQRVLGNPCRLRPEARSRRQTGNLRREITRRCPAEGHLLFTFRGRAILRRAVTLQKHMH
jgi:hypothetical protein